MEKNQKQQLVEAEVERQYTPLTRLCDLVRPYLQDDVALLRAFHEVMGLWLAEAEGEEGASLKLVQYGP